MKNSKLKMQKMEPARANHGFQFLIFNF